MTGIYLTALLTSGLAAVLFGLVNRKLRQPADEQLVWLAFLFALPLQPLAFYCLRLPLDHWLVGQLGAKSSSYGWLTSLYAPLTEEPAKLIPLLLPAVFRDIRKENFIRYAFAIGFGFAIGEMWFIAERITQVPQLAALPFYQFTGYTVERLMTCVFHTVFVAVALRALRRRFALGFLGAVALHWLGNFPISLSAWNVGGLGKTAWTVILMLWLIAYFVTALALLSYFIYGQFAPGKFLYGRRHCPGCHQDFDPSLMGVNMGSTRYERCPHCQRWHWTKPASVSPTPPGS